MNPAKSGGQSNPHHKPETSSEAITKKFECTSLNPDLPEVLARERERRKRLQNTNADGKQPPTAD